MLLLLSWWARARGPGKGVVVSPVKGQGQVKLRLIGDLNSSLFMYVDYQDLSKQVSHSARSDDVIPPAESELSPVAITFSARKALCNFNQNIQNFVT